CARNRLYAGTVVMLDYW
nr:immunoglobulin heavy chain junction region [Macaca mulatta]MOV47736.1 immunoglobulin heavy chain junction region [Macaca mulatta]MOV47862.1 immunoglobulin heavy chain junction region [Macaca mulatta]MOV48022.1 immunoglobulin heavy chain junction region [Macaca mulatta]MOV48358.1 immunoglobulin heavy chain junction region [Macaca mulatta]